MTRIHRRSRAGANDSLAVFYWSAVYAKTLINTYREPTDLFVNGITLLSEEGTTQGDPFAMPLYALATTPLIRRLDSADDLKQVWYADDASASGSLKSIRSWWDELSTVGPAYGYNANASKTWLVTKEEHLSRAKEVFQSANVNITCEGRPYLGAPLGSNEYIKQFVLAKVDNWTRDLQLLSDIAKAHPHAAYTAFITGGSRGGPMGPGPPPRPGRPGAPSHDY